MLVKLDNTFANIENTCRFFTPCTNKSVKIILFVAVIDRHFTPFVEQHGIYLNNLISSETHQICVLLFFHSNFDFCSKPMIRNVRKFRGNLFLLSELLCWCLETVNVDILLSTCSCSHMKRLILFAGEQCT